METRRVLDGRPRGAILQVQVMANLDGFSRVSNLQEIYGRERAHADEALGAVQASPRAHAAD